MTSWNPRWKQESLGWAQGILSPGPAIEPNTAYLTIRLRTTHACDLRRRAPRMHAVIHARTTIEHKEGRSAFHAFAMPRELQSASATIDRVVEDPIPVAGPVPYRSGTVDIELALLTVEATPMTTRYVAMLADVARSVGVSYLANTASPAARAVVDGLESLRLAEELMFEVGVSISAPPATGTYYVMRSDTPPDQISVDANYRLLVDGRPARAPYLVFTIEQDPTRLDLVRISEVVDQYNRLARGVRGYTKEDVAGLLKAFELTVSWCPDLLDIDVTKLVGRVRALVRPPGPVQFAGSALALPRFEELLA